MDKLDTDGYCKYYKNMYEDWNVSEQCFPKRFIIFVRCPSVETNLKVLQVEIKKK